MVYLDSTKIMKCIDVKSITKETVTLKVDGVKLLNELYQDLKIELKDGEGPIQELIFQDDPFIQIYPNEIFTEKECKQLAIEIKNTLNNRIKSNLNME